MSKTVKLYDRRKIIYGKLRKDIVLILRNLCEYKGVVILEGTACIEHIYVCLSILPNYSVSVREYINNQET